MKEGFRKTIRCLGILVVFAGAGAALWPMVSDQVITYQAGKEIEEYEDSIKDAQTEKIGAMLEEAYDYNAALSGEDVSVADYNETLPAAEALGYLEIPKIGVYLPIYHGLDEEVLKRGIGHILQTSLPVGGASTHCVLSGHSGLPAARLLTELDEMEEGDLFFLHVLGDTLAYQVDQISVVLPDDTSGIQIEEGKDYVTLLTCTPYGVNSHRLLVRGERTRYIPDPEKIQNAHDAIRKRRIVTVGLTAAGVIFLLTGTGMGYRKKKKVKGEKAKDGKEK